MKTQTKTDLTKRVKDIICEALAVDEQALKANADFRDDLGADSLDRIEMLMAMEEAFAIQIPDEDAEKIKTVQQCVDYVKKHAT
jgi:acyl carrier protein